VDVGAWRGGRRQADGGQAEVGVGACAWGETRGGSGLEVQGSGIRAQGLGFLCSVFLGSRFRA
jgi:hypothetical protein